MPQEENDIPQGSVLAPLLLNIYTSDLTTTVSRKCIRQPGLPGPSEQKMLNHL